MQENMMSYEVGDISLTVISEGTIQASAATAFESVGEAAWKPLVEVDEAGYMTLGLNILHIAFEGHSILLDTGVGEPHPTRENFEQAFPSTPKTGLIPSLSTIGISPEQITLVVFSHAHSDHVMGATEEKEGMRVPTFPNAEYLLMRKDWEAASIKEKLGSVFDLHLRELHEQGHLTLVDGTKEIAPGLKMIPAPGESPGHAIVRMDSGGQTVFYVGDLFHHPAEVMRLDWVWPGRNQAQMLLSRETLVEEALSLDAVLITAHMRFPGMGKLRRGPDGLEWVVFEPEP